MRMMLLFALFLHLFSAHEAAAQPRRPIAAALGAACRGMTTPPAGSAANRRRPGTPISMLPSPPCALLDWSAPAAPCPGERCVSDGRDQVAVFALAWR